jgi:hypothetical protein
MRPVSRWIKITAIALLWPLVGAPLAAAQTAEQPVMQNVFFNVVWGSANGALLGAAAAVIGSRNKENPSNLGGAAFQGATIGGIIGLGIGLWLVYGGITFDEQATISANQPLNPAQLAAMAPPVTLLTSPDKPGQITGFSARVLNLRF